MLLIIDLFLRTDGLMNLYDMLSQYVYDVIENSASFKACQAELDAALADPERKDDNALLNKLIQNVNLSRPQRRFLTVTDVWRSGMPIRSVIRIRKLWREG